jgi:hypothetical protein
VIVIDNLKRPNNTPLLNIGTLFSSSSQRSFTIDRLQPDGSEIKLDMCFDTVLDEVVQNLLHPKNQQAKLAVDLISDIGSGGTSPSPGAIHRRYIKRLRLFRSKHKLQLCDLSETFLRIWMQVQTNHVRYGHMQRHAHPDDPIRNVNSHWSPAISELKQMETINDIFMKWIIYLRTYYSHRNQKTVIMTRPEFSDVNGDMDLRYNSEHFPAFDLHLSKLLDQNMLNNRPSDKFTNM